MGRSKKLKSKTPRRKQKKVTDHVKDTKDRAKDLKKDANVLVDFVTALHVDSQKADSNLAQEQKDKLKKKGALVKYQKLSTQNPSWKKYYASRGTTLETQIKDIHGGAAVDDTNCSFIGDHKKYRALMTLCYPLEDGKSCKKRVCFDPYEILKQKSKDAKTNPLRSHLITMGFDKSEISETVDSSFWDMLKVYTEVYDEGKLNSILEADTADEFFIRNFLLERVRQFLYKFPGVAMVGNIFSKITPKFVKRYVKKGQTGNKFFDFVMKIPLFKLVLPMLSQCIRVSICVFMNGFSKTELRSALEGIFKSVLGGTLGEIMLNMIQVLTDCLGNDLISCGETLVISTYKVTGAFGKQIVQLTNDLFQYLVKLIMGDKRWYARILNGSIGGMASFLEMPIVNTTYQLFGWNADTKIDNELQNLMGQEMARTSTPFKYMAMAYTVLFIADQVDLDTIVDTVSWALEKLAKLAMGAQAGAALASGGVSAVASGAQGVVLVNGLLAASKSVKVMKKYGETGKTFVVYITRKFLHIYDHYKGLRLIMTELYQWGYMIFGCVFLKTYNKFWPKVAWMFPDQFIVPRHNALVADGDESCCLQEVIASMKNKVSTINKHAKAGGYVGKAVTGLRTVGGYIFSDDRLKMKLAKVVKIDGVQVYLYRLKHKDKKKRRALFFGISANELRRHPKYKHAVKKRKHQTRRKKYLTIKTEHLKRELVDTLHSLNKTLCGDCHKKLYSKSK